MCFNPLINSILCMLMLVLIWVTTSHAKSLGTFGASFPVAEQSLLQLIAERLSDLSQSGKLEALENQWLIEVRKKADRPSPLTLTRATQNSTHLFKPEVVLGQDISDAQGKILYPIGTKVNALERLPAYQPCWIFFNADDEAQLNWVAKFLVKPICSNPTIILTGGSVFKTAKTLNSIIYFDQAARISTKLNINAVPALVTRKENALLINEFALTEDGSLS